MTDDGKRKISSLRELPQDIAPPRDLWREIEASIASKTNSAVGGGAGAPRLLQRASWTRVLAAAAVVSALAVGVWIGRTMLPVGRPGMQSVQTASNTQASGPGAFKAAYLMDPKYTRDRAELVKGLEAQMARLPPESRAKVAASLKAINDSKQALEKELGRDPSNALLQELLVNTYQDEMRVLTTVHEAGGAGEGI